MDANQPAIVRALRAAGFHVTVLSRVGDGVPDLLVSDCRPDWHLLMEVKMPGGTLNDEEAKFFERCPGPKCIVYSVDDALAEATKRRAGWQQ